MSQEGATKNPDNDKHEQQKLNLNHEKYNVTIIN